MIYEFQNAAGEVREFDFPMASAPSIGDTIRRDGERWRRMAPRRVVMATKGLDYRVRPKGVLGRGLPRKHSMDPELQQHVDGWSKKGDPMFESDTAARRWTDRANAKLEREGSSTAFDYSKDQPSGEDICEMQDNARKAMYRNA